MLCRSASLVGCYRDIEDLRCALSITKSTGIPLADNSPRSNSPCIYQTMLQLHGRRLQTAVSECPLLEQKTMQGMDLLLHLYRPLYKVVATSSRGCLPKVTGVSANGEEGRPRADRRLPQGAASQGSDDPEVRWPCSPRRRGEVMNSPFSEVDMLVVAIYAVNFYSVGGDLTNTRHGNIRRGSLAEAYHSRCLFSVFDQCLREH
ncbi:hypothetical protein DENSPDRAFT_712831 [Dentipellis sp. KUC8613]|nr:hypothetical protein DENSPDRAFT_712831 [Dentipellis sp. KUC8613]